MPTVKAHFDGKVFVPDEPVDLEPGTPTEVVIPDTIESAASKPSDHPRLAGWLQGKAWIAPDFDAPLEDFREYME
jgi:hypothetical protein